MSLTEERPNTESLKRKTFEGSLHVPNVAIFLKRITIEFLQILFKTRGDFTYDSDDSCTKIQITDQFTVDLESVHTRPAIVGIRGPVTWMNRGLGGGSQESRDMKTGSFLYNDVLIGSMAFSCLSREGIEAEQIAHLVFNSFKFFRPVLQAQGVFHLKSLNIGAESLVVQEGDNDDLHIVPVYISAQVQDRWRLSNTTAQKLEQIIIEALDTSIS